MRAKVNKSSFSSTPPAQSFSSTPTKFTTLKSSQKSKPTIILASLQARLQKPKSKIHWDNACSYHVTNDPTLLSHMQPIPPDTFLGVGGFGSATHAGYVPFLPSHNFLNIGYYSPDFPQTLLSLGHLQACGGAYASSTTPNEVKIYAVDSDPT